MANSQSQNFPLSPDPLHQPQYIQELYSKLRGDYGPAASSVPEADIQALLSLSSKDLQECTFEIGRLQDSLENLKREMNRLTSSLAAFKAKRKILFHFQESVQSLSKPCPARKLPSEILATVFEYACENNVFMQCYPERDFQSQKEAKEFNWELNAERSSIRDLSTLAVSSVCSRWRSLALNNRRLWAGITIDVKLLQKYWLLHPYGEQRWEEEADLDFELKSSLALFLERSAPYPLLLKFTKILDDHGLSVLLSLLLPYADRWKSLSINETFGYPAHLSLLEELNWNTDSEDWDSESFFAFFTNTPKLRTLTTPWPEFDEAPPSLFSQLTSLCVTAGYTDMRNILNLAPNLTTLKLDNFNLQVPNTPASPKRFPELSSLTLCLGGSSSAKKNFLHSVFAFHTFPSLKELRITNAKGNPWNDLTVGLFQEFLSRSSCSIRLLSIRRYPVEDIEIVSILRLLPSLVDLCIEDTDNSRVITPLLISHLHRPDGPSTLEVPFLPNLRHLTLISERSERTEADVAALARMAISRWLPNSAVAKAAGVACLRTLVVDIQETMTSDGLYAHELSAYAPLRDLDKQGMQVVVKLVQKSGRSRKQLLIV